MEFEIEVPLPCVTDIFESNTIAVGMSKDVPGDANIQLRPSGMPMQKRSMTHDAAPYFIVAVTMAGTAGSAIGLNLFSSWLYDRLKARPGVRRIRINRRITEVSLDGIRRSIEESYEMEEQRCRKLRTQSGLCFAMNRAKRS